MDVNKLNYTFKKYDLWFLLPALLLFATMLFFQLINDRFWLNDFVVFYNTTKAYLADEQVYGVLHGLESGRYKYLPFSLLLFAPITFFPFKVVALGQFIIIAISTVVGVHHFERLWSRLYCPAEGRASIVVMFLAFIIPIIHFIRELHLGNINMELLFLLFLFITFLELRKPWLAAICFSVALTFKPYVAVLGLIMLLNKNYRAILFTGILTALFSASIFLVNGFSYGMNLYLQWKDTVLLHNRGSKSAQTISSLLETHMNISFLKDKTIFTYLALVLLGSLLFELIKRKRPEINKFLFLYLNAFWLIALIPSVMITDTQHFLFSTPLIVFLIHWSIVNRNYALLSLTLLFAIPYGFNSSDVWGSDISFVLEQKGVLGLANLYFLIMPFYLLYYYTVPSSREQLQGDK